MNKAKEQTTIHTFWIVYFYKSYLKNFFKDSFIILKTNILAILRVNLFVLAIFVLNTYLSALLSMRLSYIRNNQNLFLYIFAIPVFTYFLAGSIHYYMGILKKRTVSVYQIFTGYRWFIPLFIYNSLIYILFMIFCFSAITFLQHDLIFQIRIVLGLLFFFWFLLRSLFTAPLIIEFSLSTRQALHISFQLTRERFWEIILYFFIAFLIGISGILLFGFAFLFSLGFFVISSLLLFYALVKNEPALYNPGKFILELNPKKKKNS